MLKSFSSYSLLLSALLLRLLHTEGALVLTPVGVCFVAKVTV